MRSFRLQLKYQREYLLQCRIKPFLESENFQFSHFDFERIDWYSLNDFLAIGEMLKKLQTIAKDGRNHIVNCEWCRQLGCICEICSDDEVIFPFDANMVYRVSVMLMLESHKFLVFILFISATSVLVCFMLIVSMKQGRVQSVNVKQNMR